METNMTRNASRAAKVLSGVVLAMMTTFASADDGMAATPGAAAAAPGASPLAIKLAPERAHYLVNKWCSACHGYYGRSIAPTFPNLAGQSAEYIAQELQYFHNLTQDDRAVTHESWIEQWLINITGLRSKYRYDDAPRNEFRAWDFMKGVARDLDPPTMQALGEYFAKQTPAPGKIVNTGDIARGKTLYLEGDADKGLIACQSCHGPEAKGQGPIPRLAGQHADYVYLQLKYIQKGTRNVEQMQALITNLTEADFKALAAYVQSLN
jgi:cytochrome c553